MKTIGAGATCIRGVQIPSERAAAGSGSACDAVVGAVPLLPPHARILDVGCGPGDDALFMVKMGFDVTAIDRSAEAVAHLKGRLEHVGGRAEVFVANMHEFIFIRTFAFVNMQYVLHEVAVDEWQPFWEHASQHTAPGGIHSVAVITGQCPGADGKGGAPSFEAGELVRLYDGWEILSYHCGDQAAITGPDGIKRCKVDRITARKPTGE